MHLVTFHRGLLLALICVSAQSAVVTAFLSATYKSCYVFWTRTTQSHVMNEDSMYQASHVTVIKRDSERLT